MNKQVIIHVDDIGSSVSTNRAALNLLESGNASSGSIMVPCSGFQDFVSKIDIFKKHDLGIHLTLTSEWKDEHLKWKPTLPINEVSSLVDKNGYFPSEIDDVLYKADHNEIKRELLNQVEILQRLGINISHIDSHMGVLLHKRLFPIYKEIAEVLNIQPFISRGQVGDTQGNWFYDCDDYTTDLEKKGFKILDQFNADSLYEGPLEYDNHCIARINSIKEGTTYFLLHVLDNYIDEQEKTPDYILRQKEYLFFNSASANNYFIKNNISKIKIKEL